MYIFYCIPRNKNLFHLAVKREVIIGYCRWLIIFLEMEELKYNLKFIFSPTNAKNILYLRFFFSFFLSWITYKNVLVFNVQSKGHNFRGLQHKGNIIMHWFWKLKLHWELKILHIVAHIPFVSQYLWLSSLFEIIGGMNVEKLWFSNYYV